MTGLPTANLCDKNKNRTACLEPYPVTSPAPFSLVFETEIAAANEAFVRYVRSSSDLAFDGEDAGKEGRFYLLFEGMSFMLAIRSVSPAVQAYHPIFYSKSAGQLRSSLEIAFGEKLENGMKVPALAQGYLQFVAKITRDLGAVAICAVESGLIADAAYFADAVQAYADGGAFPALAMIAFEDIAKDDAIVTRGLDLFAGQEIVFHGAGLQRNEMMRRMVRLVHDLCTNGRVHEYQMVDDLEPGSVLILDPDRHPDTLHVTLRFGGNCDLP
jgi:hypothetical protein